MQLAFVAGKVPNENQNKTRSYGQLFTIVSLSWKKQSSVVCTGPKQWISIRRNMNSILFQKYIIKQYVYLHIQYNNNITYYLTVQIKH